MPLLTSQLLRRLEQFQLLAACRVEFVAKPALIPALSPRRGRIPRRVLRQGLPSVLQQFSPANHRPAARGNSTSVSSQRVCSLSPLPAGDEGERHSNFSATNQPPKRDERRDFGNDFLCIQRVSAVESSPRAAQKPT